MPPSRTRIVERYMTSSGRHRGQGTRQVEESVGLERSQQFPELPTHTFQSLWQVQQCPYSTLTIQYSYLSVSSSLIPGLSLGPKQSRPGTGEDSVFCSNRPGWALSSASWRQICTVHFYFLLYCAVPQNPAPKWKDSPSEMGWWCSVSYKTNFVSEIHSLTWSKPAHTSVGLISPISQLNCTKTLYLHGNYIS